MSAVDKIEAVLGTHLLTPELTIIPARGVTKGELAEEEALLNRRFCADHVALLSRWNGIGLEVVRFFGCGVWAGEVGRLAELQIPLQTSVPGAIVVGSDASGFVYFQLPEGHILSFDTDSRDERYLAQSLDEFVDRIVFGSDAASFGGESWLQELQDAGIVH